MLFRNLTGYNCFHPPNDRMIKAVSNAQWLTSLHQVGQNPIHRLLQQAVGYKWELMGSYGNLTGTGTKKHQQSLLWSQPRSLRSSSPLHFRIQSMISWSVRQESSRDTDSNLSLQFTSCTHCPYFAKCDSWLVEDIVPKNLELIHSLIYSLLLLLHWAF